MIRKSFLMAIAMLMIAAMPLNVIAASNLNVPNGQRAAESLSHLGLFMGTGINPDGTLDFALNRQPTRLETAIMFVRLIGGSEEAYSRSWSVPFTDVPSWGLPYIGYAVHNNLVFGVGPTRFGSNDIATSYQFITLVLRALGYTSGVHFDWQTPWILSDQKGITNGRFNTATRTFTRGDIAEISLSALGATFANSSVTLAESLIDAGVFTVEQAQFAGVPLTQDFIRDGLVVAPTPTPGATPMPGASPVPSPTPLPTPSPSPVPASVRVAPSSSTINARETISMTASILPQAAANAPLTWSSSNTSVATVSNVGVVTGVAEGTATITASTANGHTSTSTITVRRLKSTITLPNRRLTDAERAAWIADYRAHGGATANEREVIRLVNIERRNRGLVEVQFDDVLMMAARFYAQQIADLNGYLSHNFGPYADLPGQGWYPWGASYNVVRAFGGQLRWGGGNGFSGGEMSAADLVRGWMNSPGHRAYILSPEHRFIGAGQFPGGISYMFLSDRASGQAVQMPTSVTVSPTSATINVGTTQTITATVLPANAQNRTVTWTSSNTSVASVSSAGVVTGLAAGTATITATTSNGLTASATITVAAAAILPTGVTVSPSVVSLNIGASENLVASVTPANATDRSVTWQSSNSGVATVSNTGVVTAVSAGTATITATTSNGLTATATITVASADVLPTEVTVSPTTLTLNIGDTENLTAVVTPANATDRSVTWQSSDQSVATVSSTGAVIAVSEGIAIITATTTNGLTATSTVTVLPNQQIDPPDIDPDPPIIEPDPPIDG